MKQKNQKQLMTIKREDTVKILYACESGSRAWGFASRDSDWDVRLDDFLDNLPDTHLPNGSTRQAIDQLRVMKNQGKVNTSIEPLNDLFRDMLGGMKE